VKAIVVLLVLHLSHQQLRAQTDDGEVSVQIPKSEDGLVIDLITKSKPDYVKSALDLGGDLDASVPVSGMAPANGTNFLLDGQFVGSPTKPIHPTNVFSLKLESARKFALLHQLDIRAELIPPKIAEEQVREARARFQSVVSGNLALEEESPVSPAPETDSASGSLGLRRVFGTGASADLSLRASRREIRPLPLGVPPRFYSVDPTLTLSQPLLRGAGLRINHATINRSRLLKRQTTARSRLLINNLIANVDRGYWRLWSAEQELRVRHEQYKIASKQLTNASKLVKAGIVPKLEITRSLVGLSQRVNTIIAAETSRKILDRELKRIMNLKHLPLTSQSVIVLQSDPTLFPLELDRFELTTAALKNRMDLLESQLQVAIELMDKDVARNQLLPDVSLGFNYTSGALNEQFGGAFRELDNPDSSSWQVGLTFSYPLGNDAAKARHRQAALRHALSLNSLERRRLVIQQGVHDAIDRLIQSWQQIQAAIRETVLAQQIYQGELKQFESGFRTSTEVLDAAQSMAHAQVRHVRAISEFEISKVELAYATGAQLGYAEVKLN
tara:strand:+ start:894 stop:2567 length:1674 start_codon:yes stop_codon:yes gene_type:complete